MSKSHQFGKDAENEAAEWFLFHRKARLIARNYRCKVGEIDLVFEEVLEELVEEKGDRLLELVFVEVKARAENTWIDGPKSVGWTKLQRLERAIQRFLMGYNGQAKSARVDLLSKKGTKWEHRMNVLFH